MNPTTAAGSPARGCLGHAPVPRRGRRRRSRPMGFPDPRRNETARGGFTHEPAPRRIGAEGAAQ